MNDTVVWIAWIVVGVPVLCAFAAGVSIAWMKMRVKHRELKLQEQRLAAEERLRTDEHNARILRMDDLGLSPAEIASLADDVRRLREEVAQLRQEITNRTTG